MEDYKKIDNTTQIEITNDPFKWVEGLPQKHPFAVSALRPQGESREDSLACVLLYEPIPEDRIEGLLVAMREAIEEANTIYEKGLKAVEDRQRQRNQTDRRKH